MIALLVRDTDTVKRSLRRASLRYACMVLRSMGYVGAAAALAIYVDRQAPP